MSDIVAQVIVAEIGTDMSRFPTAGHLRSWAGLCPRHDESAGKRRSARIRKSSNRLEATLVIVAWAAVHNQHTSLYAQFVRLRARRGAKKAMVAVAASMLTAAYHTPRDDVEYRDLGANYFDRRDREKAAVRLVRRLGDLGASVELRDAA